MSTPTESKRNNWLFPAFILWGVAPAILMVGGAIGGPNGGLEQLSILSFIGMPVILYPWSVSLLRWLGRSSPLAYGLGILLAILMCVVNFVLAFAGCAWLTDVMV